MMANIVLSILIFISKSAFAAESFEPFVPVSIGSHLEFPRSLTWLYGERPPIRSWHSYTWVFVFIPTDIKNIDPILNCLDEIQKHTSGVKTVLVAVPDAPQTESQVLLWRDQLLQKTKNVTSEQRWQSSTWGHGLAFDESHFFLRRWLRPSGTASRLPVAFLVNGGGRVVFIDQIHNLNDIKYFNSHYADSIEFQISSMVFTRDGTEWVDFERARVLLENAAESGDWDLALQLASQLDEEGPTLRNWRNWSSARVMRLKALFHLGRHAEHIGTARIYEQEDAQFFNRKSRVTRFASELLWWQNHKLVWRQDARWMMKSRADLFQSFLDNSSADEIGRNRLIRRWATSYEKSFLNLSHDAELDFAWLSYIQPLEQAGKILDDSTMINRYAEIRLGNEYRLKCYRQLLPARSLGIEMDANAEARSTLIRFEME